MWGLSLVAVSRDHSSSRCAGLSLSRPLLLRSTGSRRAGSVVVAHGPSCSGACGIFPDQGSNPCPLHWQADSQPLRHQGSPQRIFLCINSLYSQDESPVWYAPLSYFTDEETEAQSCWAGLEIYSRFKLGHCGSRIHALDHSATLPLTTAKQVRRVSGYNLETENTQSFKQGMFNIKNY